MAQPKLMEDGQLVAARIPGKALEELKRLALTKGINQSTLVREILVNWIECKKAHFTAPIIINKPVDNVENLIDEEPTDTPRPA